MEDLPLVRRRHSRRRAVLFTALLCTVSVAILISLLSVNMSEAMAALATARIKAIGARAMNDAILDSMGFEENYSTLIRVRENGDSVYMLEADTHKMNILAADCADAAQERIAAMGEQGISLPLGTITGIAFLSGKGPHLSVSFTPAGSVQSEFSSELVSSGINQTLYRVNLRLTASIKLVLPGVADTISVSAEAAIAESIIVGDVPEVYTNVDSIEDMLNLVPNEAP